MEKFQTIESTGIPLEMENIDTDQIIPARFLKTTVRSGLGENLFRDWRYDETGWPIPGFVLNDKTWSGKILITGKNFGSGSSREHAAWALIDYGFQVIVSSSFADIFRNNALNNGLLTVQVQEDFLKKLFTSIRQNPSQKINVNLVAQTITLLGKGQVERFEINQYKKDCLLNGYDDVDYLLNIRDKIEEFEQKQKITLAD